MLSPFLSHPRRSVPGTKTLPAPPLSTKTASASGLPPQPPCVPQGAQHLAAVTDQFELVFQFPVPLPRLLQPESQAGFSGVGTDSSACPGLAPASASRITLHPVPLPEHFPFQK